MLAVNRYSTVRDSMEDGLRTGTPYRISCLRQQPSGVDRRCQIWPIRGYTRFWYTVMSFSKLISQAFPRPLPQSSSFFPALSLALFFARAPLSEHLEQAIHFPSLCSNSRFVFARKSRSQKTCASVFRLLLHFPLNKDRKRGP